MFRMPGSRAVVEPVTRLLVPLRWTAPQRLQARLNISGVLKGQLFGLTLSAAGGSATFGIAAGEAADSTGVDLMVLASAYTKTTSAWAIGTAAGSLDTGAIAINTWYHVFEIKRPDTGVVDVATSLSASAPTTGGNIPAAYTIFRRIGSMMTDGSSQWIKFVQYGDYFNWAVQVNDVQATNPGTAAVTRTLTVPTGVQVLAKLSVGAVSALGSTPAAIYISDLAITDSTPGLTTGIFTQSNFVVTAATEADSGSFMEVRTNTSAQVRSRIQITSANTILCMATHGWLDTRGRDA